MQVYPCMVIIWINFGLPQNIIDTKMSILGTQLSLSGDEDDDEDDFEWWPCMLRTYLLILPWDRALVKYYQNSPVLHITDVQDLSLELETGCPKLAIVIYVCIFGHPIFQGVPIYSDYNHKYVFN